MMSETKSKSMNNDDSILTITGLTKTFTTATDTLTILRGLDLKVREGTRAVITGESGSGKSTLLHLIAGLDTPTSGSITVAGLSLDRLDEEDLGPFRSRTLGLIFQFHYLLKDFTALENVYLPAYLVGVPKKQAQEKAASLLDAVGLADRSTHLPSELSGGERQRCAVARSLINDPPLILADEPTGNLDPGNAELIGSLLFNLCARYGKTLLMVTHDQLLAKQGDTRYSLTNGVLVKGKEGN
jgi:lipoprotein-releasing system ATP-binding protein